jgi:hypothetical protein
LCAKLRHKEPEQFDRLSFLPGEEMQVDYGEGAPTRVLGGDRYRKPASVRGHAALFPRQFPLRGLEVQPADLG